MAGLFITFEGGEGCGKSTQIAVLKKRLEGEGHTVVQLREPGGTGAGDRIRGILLSSRTGDLNPMSELLLFTAARCELVEKVIKPALKRGDTVICDRFADSTLAYQGYGRGLDKEMIRTLSRAACGSAWPDVTLLLDLPVEVGLKRSMKRLAQSAVDEGRFEAEKLSFHQKIRDGFLCIAKAEPYRLMVVDATGDVGSVAARVHSVLTRSLGD